jgi:fructose-bisphosphate aldolase, class I
VVVETFRRRIRRLFAFERGIVALDAAHRPLAPDRPWPSRTTSGVVLSPGVFERTPGLPRRLRADGVLTGVRADRGTEALTPDGRALVTAGSDGLTERLARLRALGATFAVWHVPPVLTGHRTASYALAVNGQAAARFARTCQELDVLPLVRVRHPGAGSGAAHATALMSLCSHLDENDVRLDAVVLSTRDEPGAPAGTAGQPGPAGGALAALPGRLGGVALAVDAVSPADAALSVAGARAGGLPWPVTFYLGREATAPALPRSGGRPALHVVH